MKASRSEKDLIKEIQSLHSKLAELKQQKKECELRMKRYQKRFMKSEAKDFSLIRDIFDKYGPAKSDFNSPAYSINMTIMNLRGAPEEMKHMSVLEGYLDKNTGDYPLAGHIKFTPAERLVLEKYHITWCNAYIGRNPGESLKVPQHIRLGK